MEFDLSKSVEILKRTPAVLTELLNGLDSDWLYNNEGPDTWSPYIVIGHLIEGEKTDWIPRMQIILSENKDKRFTPFNRLTQLDQKLTSIDELIREFNLLRSANIAILLAANLSAGDLAKKGLHPEFGEVTLQQLLATWVVHDLGHIYQITRVMANQYKEAVGPWTAYLSILKTKYNNSRI